VIHDNAEHPHGRAHKVHDDELASAGFFRYKTNSLVVGFSGKRAVYWNGQGGLLTVAGPRGRKFTAAIAYNTCHGIYGGSMLILDMKAEIAAVSRDQVGANRATRRTLKSRLCRLLGISRTPRAKSCIYWNPAKLHDLPQDRINPCDYLVWGSPTLISDIKVFCQNILPKSGSANASFFEERGQSFLEAIIYVIVKIDGVLTLPRLFEIINLLPGGGERWLDFAFEMHSSNEFPLAVAVEEEIAASRNDNSGGIRGILAECSKAVAPLSDDILMASVSPPYTASLADMLGDHPYHFYLMPPAEFIESWAPVLKAFFIGGMIWKARSPSAPQQTWILDECAQLGNFPLVIRLFTYGAGINIRPWAFYQSIDQLRATGPNAEKIIPASASVQQYFAVREVETATMLKRLSGTQSLHVANPLQQARSDHAYKQAVQNLLSGADPISAALEIAHHEDAAIYEPLRPRDLLKEDEILRMQGKMILYADGLSGTCLLDLVPYYEQRFMAGYHPNPYHPPLDKVRVKTRFGHACKRVNREPVPPEYAHLPQHADGMWSYIEPLRWWE